MSREHSLCLVQGPIADGAQVDQAICQVEAVGGRVVAPQGTALRVWQLVAASPSLLRFWWSDLLFPNSPSVILREGWFLQLLLGVLAALLLFTELNYPLVDPDEGRQAEVPREMLAHHDLLLPRMLGEPYYEKPPLQYWLTAGAYTLLGAHAWVARLVPALAAWLAVQLTFLWGKRALGDQAAFMGALALLLMPGFVILGRTVVLDSLLTASVAASWYSAHLAIVDRRLRWPLWLFSALVCGLGMLAKGPVALVLVLPPVLAYQLLMPAAARPRCLSWMAYVAVAAIVAAPWYTLMAWQEPNYLEHFFWKANLLRFVSPYDHEQPWWFYIPVLLGLTFPWCFLAPATLYFLFSPSKHLVNLRSSGLGFCVLASSWSLLFFSASGCKSPFYIVPAFPPLALLFGACLETILFQPAGQSDSRFRHVREFLPFRITLLLLLISAGGCCVAALLGWQERALSFAEGIGFLVLAVAWWRSGRRVQPLFAWGGCALATTFLLVIPARDLLEGYASRHTPASVAHFLRPRHWPTGLPLVSYARQWPSASFYGRRDLIPFYDQVYRQALLDFLSKAPEAMVLVESGPPLQEVLNGLPAGVEIEVHLPEHSGQAALLVVRQHGFH